MQWCRRWGQHGQAKPSSLALLTPGSRESKNWGGDPFVHQPNIIKLYPQWRSSGTRRALATRSSSCQWVTTLLGTLWQRRTSMWGSGPAMGLAMLRGQGGL